MELFVTFLASILVWLMFLGLTALWIIDGRVKKEQALHALLAAMFAWTISEIIKQIYPIPRPYHVNDLQPLTLSLNHSDGSFPSSHAALAFSISFALYLHNKKLGSIFLVGATLVGLGRVLSNVHYFADVIGGGTVGLASAAVLEKLHLYKLIDKTKANKK